MTNREEERNALWNSCPNPPAERADASSGSEPAYDLSPRPPLDGTQPATSPPNAPPQAFHPWRRYLARMLDFNLYSLIWSAILGLGFHVNLLNLGAFFTLFNTFVAVLIMLCVEPLLLQRLGTTPGKALFGLRITFADGSRLTHREAQARTLTVIGAGMGYGIPFYNLYRNWKSYQLCSQRTAQPWDYGISYTMRDKKGVRCVAFVGAALVLVFCNVTLNLSQQLPPNRGDLTLAEFSDNYQYYVHYLQMDLGGFQLGQDGRWVKPPQNSNTLYINWTDHEPPTYEYIVENGVLTGVSFTVEETDTMDWITPYDNDMGLITLAFLGAQKEVGVFSSDLTIAVEKLSEEPFGSYQFTQGGLTISCETACTGFVTPATQLLLPEEGAASTYFRQVFTIRKQ